MKIRFAEWVSFIISLVIILGMAGFLIYELTREEAKYAQIEIEVSKDRVETSQGRQIAKVLIHNRSRKAAKQVKVMAVDAEFDLDYLPAESTEELYILGTKEELDKLKPEAISYLEN